MHQNSPAQDQEGDEAESSTDDNKDKILRQARILKVRSAGLGRHSWRRVIVTAREGGQIRICDTLSHHGEILYAALEQYSRGCQNRGTVMLCGFEVGLKQGKGDGDWLMG